MISVTDRAAETLQQLLEAQGAPEDQGVKLVPGPTGSIGMVVAPPAEGDEVVRRAESEAPLLIVAAPIVSVVDGATLDVQTATGDGSQAPQFTLRPPAETS